MTGRQHRQGRQAALPGDPRHDDCEGTCAAKMYRSEIKSQEVKLKKAEEEIESKNIILEIVYLKKIVA